MQTTRHTKVLFQRTGSSVLLYLPAAVDARETLKVPPMVCTLSSPAHACATYLTLRERDISRSWGIEAFDALASSWYWLPV